MKPFRYIGALLILLILPTTQAQAQVSASNIEADPSVIAPLAAKSLILDGDLAGDRIILVGERGHILVSDDNGNAWRQITVPHDTMLTSVDFLDRQQGLAAGHDAIILSTNDRGETWRIVNFQPTISSPSAFMDILYIDRREALAVGTYGLALRSNDGGNNWRQFELAPPNEYGENVHLNALVYDGDETILVPAEFGELYISHDRGRSFELIPDTPYFGSFFGGLSLGGPRFLVFGLEGMMFETADAGESWVEIDTGVSVSLQGGYSNGTDIYVVGLNGALLSSHDGGENFTSHIRPDRVALSQVVKASDGRYLLLGEAGVIALGADGAEY